MSELPRKHEVGSSVLAAEHFLDNHQELRRLLRNHGALNFTPYPSGLFPASELPEEIAEETGMGMAWLRDNAHIAMALYECGDDEQRSQGEAAIKAMLQVLKNNEHLLDQVNSSDTTIRLPVRVDGATLENDSEPRRQNDSTGYALWAIGRLINDGALWPDGDTTRVLEKTVHYLASIEYWHDEDEGHWEEDRRIHISSIGTAIAGLREMKTIVPVPNQYIDDMITKGSQQIDRIRKSGLTDDLYDHKPFAPESPYPVDDRKIDPHVAIAKMLATFSVKRRQYDAALLFLVVPLGVVETTDPTAFDIVKDIEQQLIRGSATARYRGDTYWMPEFDDIMSVEERTHSAEGRTESRNEKAAGIALKEAEAQWTLFDPLLSVYYGELYQQYGDQDYRAKQLHYMDRSLSQFVAGDNGSLKLPEAYYMKTIDGVNTWIPNPHIPLLWSQANVLRMLDTFEKTTRK